MTLEAIEPELLTRDRVARQLRALLRERDYRDGEAMPSERNLAKEFGVSRDTVRSAIRELVQEGLVAPKRARVRSASTGAALGDSFGSSRGASGEASLNAAIVEPAGVLSKTIAIISDSAITPESYGMPARGYAGQLFASAAMTIRNAGFHILSLAAGNLSESDIRSLTRQKLGGFIVLGYVNDSATGRKTTDIAARAGIPIVVSGDGPLLSHLDRVWSDHEAGSYALTNLLLSKGRRNIQRIWRVAEDYYWVKARNLGFERAYQEAGLQPRPPIYTANISINSVQKDDFVHLTKIMAGYLIGPLSERTPADAFMVPSDPNAYELSASLQLLGKDPAAFPIVGYDNTWETLECRQWAPNGPVATCDKGNAAVGAAMADLVLERLKGSVPQGPQRRLVIPRLIDLDVSANRAKQQHA